MDSITQAELDALAGKRGPPDSLFMLGSGEYRSQILRPNLEKERKLRESLHNSLTGNVDQPSYGTSEYPSVDPAYFQEALKTAQENVAQLEPVHHYDLKETAAKRTQELLEKENMVFNYKVYLVEDVHNSRVEKVRTRLMHFHFRVAKGTLQVYEPRQVNSSLWQGEFAKWHIPMKPDGSGAYGPRDFVVGATVWVNGHKFIIYDADTFTRTTVMERYGFDIGQPISPPSSFDPSPTNVVGHFPHKNKVVCDVGDMEDPENGFYRRAPDGKGKFIKYGNNMLRFEGEWRETGEVFGDRRRFAIQYFLADDTIEILDKSSSYARGGQFTKFIIRQRLPRVPVEAGTESAVPISASTLPFLPSMNHIAQAAAQAQHSYMPSASPTVWGKLTSPITGEPIYRPSSAQSSRNAAAKVNTLLPGPTEINGFVVTSSLPAPYDTLSASDFICGGIVSILGRPMLIKSCDPFTVAFFMQEFGIDQRHGFINDVVSADLERDLAAPELANKGPMPLYPHTSALALGSEEETRVNAKKITPSFRAERNFDRFYQLQGKSLRFEARISPDHCEPADRAREFVVSYFLEDDTLSIVEVVRDRKGSTARRFLARGKYRNGAKNAPTDEPALEATLSAACGPMRLPLEAQEAYDRVYSGSGDKYGYADGFNGQGYSGGIYGKADRVGAGGTGVPAGAGLGLRDSSSHAVAPLTEFFKSSDFYPGATIVLAHAPQQPFVLLRADAFTEAYLRSQAEAGTTDARNVYVEDSAEPVPSLPLEGTLSRVSLSGVTVDGKDLPIDVHSAALVLAKLLAGVRNSALEVIKQGDKMQRGYAPKDVVKRVLQRYGAVPPAVDPAIVDNLLSYFVAGYGEQLAAAERERENQKCKKHASPYQTKRRDVETKQLSASALIGGLGTVGTLNDPIAPPPLTDYFSAQFADVELVDYNAMFKAMATVAEKQMILQPRLDKLVSQLRAAILSSRKHLRKVFRELDVGSSGAISFPEFRNMLLKHHLDVGLNDAQIRALMARFPPATDAQISKSIAAAAAAAKQSLLEPPPESSLAPFISWRGFIEAILDSKTLAAGELDHFIDFINGLRDLAPNGVGGTRGAPEVFPHVNQVSSWTPDMDISNAMKALKMTSSGTGINTAKHGPGYSVFDPNNPTRAGLPVRATMRNAVGKGSILIQPPLPGPTNVLPVGVAPGMESVPERKTSTPIKDPRPPLDRPVLDVFEALNATPSGRNILERMRMAFTPRRLEIFRALALYDTGRKNVLNVEAFVSALISAGLKLTTLQRIELVKDLAKLATNDKNMEPIPSTVYIDYNSFLEALFA